MSQPTRPPRDPPPTSRLARLFEAKLTPGIVALFFAALALMSAAAAGIGIVVHSLGHTPGPR